MLWWSPAQIAKLVQSSQLVIGRGSRLLRYHRKWRTKAPCPHGIPGHACTFYDVFRSHRATTEVSEASHCCLSTRRDARSTQPLAERMTLQPVAHAMTSRPKQATKLRVVCIHTRACVPPTGTLTPVLHHTTSQRRGGRRSGSAVSLLPRGGAVETSVGRVRRVAARSIMHRR